MATGYFFAASNQGGSVPLKFGPNAGDGLTVYDWCLTQGPNPWTKVVTGTNTASYQAPGGSQIKLDIDDTYPISTSFYSRCRSSVGGTQFPIPAQEADGNRGGVPMIRKSMSGTSGYAYEWISVRTDRLWILYTGAPVTGQAFYTAMHVFGDLPTIDPADPGVCVNLGSFMSASYPQQALPANWFGALSTSHNNIGGHVYSNKANTLLSPLVYCNTPFIQNTSALTLADFAGVVPTCPIYVFSGCTSQTSASQQLIPRAWIPYLRILPLRPDSGYGLTVKWISNATPTAAWTGDTATIGGNSYHLMYSSTAQWTLAFMTNDGENLP